MFRKRKIHKKNAIKLICTLVCVLTFVSTAFYIPTVASAMPDYICNVVAAGIMKQEYYKTLESFASKYVQPQSLVRCDPVSVTAFVGDFSNSQQIPPTHSTEEITVVSKDLSGYEGIPRILFSNRTSYSVNADLLLENKLPFETDLKDGSPIVLILHSHGTEAYLPSGADRYSKDNTFRSTDTSTNVVSVGAIIAQILNESGIPTLHDTNMYDEISYNDAYKNSRVAARDWLEQYPTIKYIIDVHRDAIVNADGINVKPVIDIQGKSIAQLMLVIGTDEAGADHPDWRSNLTLACMIQECALEKYDGLMRPINLREASFNQQLTPCAFLLEVGSCANTVDEAHRAARIFASVFAQVIYPNE